MKDYELNKLDRRCHIFQGQLAGILKRDINLLSTLANMKALIVKLLKKLSKRVKLLAITTMAVETMAIEKKTSNTTTITSKTSTASKIQMKGQNQVPKSPKEIFQIS